MTTDLYKLRAAFDELYRDIWQICATCTDHDCEGYIYLLECEAEALYNEGVPVVELNGKVSFIHSFQEADGQVLLEQPKPPCILRQRGRCSLYTSRPLVCRMYPVGLAVKSGEVVLALYQDCAFSRGLTPDGKARFFEKVKGILRGASGEILRLLLRTYQEVDAVSALPEDRENAFEIICAFKEFLDKQERG